MKALALRLWLWLSPAAALGLVPLEAAAAEPSALSWSRLPGSEACPALGEVSARVEQHLKRRAFVAPADATLLFEASIAPRPAGGFLVRIAVSRAADATMGTRDLELAQADCSAAVDAAALALALMIDPELETRAASAAAPSSSTSFVPAPAPPASARPRLPTAEPGTPAPPVADPTPDTPCPTPPERLAVRLSAGPWLALGVLPEPGFGVAAGVLVAPASRRFSAEVVGGYLAPRRRLSRSDAGADFWATFVGLNGSWTAVRGSNVRLSLGAGVWGGTIEAGAFGFSSSSYVGVWQIDLGTHLELEVALSERWHLLLRPTVLVPTRRETFEVIGAGQREPLFVSAPVQLAFSACVAFAP